MNGYPNAENGQRDDGGYCNEDVVGGDVPFVLDLQNLPPGRERPTPARK